MEFTSKLIQLRKQHPNLHRRKFFQDRTIKGSVVRDIVWYNTDGNELSEEQWGADWNRSLGVLLNGTTLQVSDEEGKPVVDDSFLILVNAYHEGVEFTLPDPPHGKPWIQLLDTQHIDDPFKEVPFTDKVIAGGRSMRVFRDGPGPQGPDNKPAQPAAGKVKVNGATR